MSEVVDEVDEILAQRRAAFFEGVPAPKKSEAKPKKEVIMTWGKYRF